MQRAFVVGLLIAAACSGAIVATSNAWWMLGVNVGTVLMALGTRTEREIARAKSAAAKLKQATLRAEAAEMELAAGQKIVAMSLEAVERAQAGLAMQRTADDITRAMMAESVKPRQ